VDRKSAGKENAVQITEVRIKLMEDAGERLLAFCSITFDDCFVIRDLKIIGGGSGPFVAMPSRKLTSHCHQCGCKNHLRASYCNQCGSRLSQQEPAGRDDEGRAKLYADIAHPINSQCREMIQERVIQEFFQEQERAKQPGYKSRYDDFDYDEPPRPHTRPAGRGQAPHQRAGAGQGRGGAGADGQVRTPHQRQGRPSLIQGSADASSQPPDSPPPAQESGSEPDSFGAGIF
jgi:stage V sporulation protein G